MTSLREKLNESGSAFAAAAIVASTAAIVWELSGEEAEAGRSVPLVDRGLEEISCTAETSCDEVVMAGDSTSEGLPELALESELPDVDRVESMMRVVGVRRFFREFAGGRQVMVHFNVPSVLEMVRGGVAGGYRGCWVLAVGANDAATSEGDFDEVARRVAAVMSAARGGRVMWVEVKTMGRGSSSYSDVNMQVWNRVLEASCAHYPSMRVYDWAGEARGAWYGPDKIHFVREGLCERSRRIAAALARAFPRSGAESGCLVGGD